ncbi:MAG TPA: PstS family phosphate ABC transporter substrate-binding protein [Vicinamibacterales bacterium]|nr:PstS family phosphate ABC transporter substrate-binding protein [Vicinamibacterales bacterium]
MHSPTETRGHASLRLLLIVTLSAAAVACGRGNEASGATAPAQVITIDGSSTVFPVIEAVAEEFQREHRGTRVTVGSSGTGGGFQKFCRGETDISNASRPIKATEIEACTKQGIEYVELPIGYDGIAIVVHPSNTWASAMTVADLKKLWEPSAQGRITRWSQIRPDWPDREIHLFGAGVDSGTFEYFTEAIAGKAGQSRGDYTSSEDDNVIVQGVSGGPDALGYFGYAYYEQNRDKLKLVAVDDGDDTNGAGAIRPSPETVANGTYRPLSRPVFVYARVSSMDRPEIRAFLDFLLDRGQPLVREVGYVALTPREQELVRRRYSERKTGSMFAGTDHAPMTLEQRLTR